MSAEDVKQLIDNTLTEHRVVIFSKTYCGYCTKAKKALYQFLDKAKVYVLEVSE